MPLTAVVDPGGENYLQWAKSKISFWHKQMLQSGQTVLNKTILVDDATRIYVKMLYVGNNTFIDKVRITAGVLLNFLMVKKNGDYYALFKNGEVEGIRLTGSPQPPLYPSRLTKGYVVPTELQLSNSAARSAASRYTGLMRGVIGCYYSRGISAPFSSTYTCTHGIIKKTLTVDGTATDLYWIVELCKYGEPEAGIYIAPITYTGTCSGSWSVTAYMPTTAERAADPTITTRYGTRLSLAWALTAGRANVSRIVEGAAMPTGDVWRDTYGWALSETGAEAQQVTYHKIIDFQSVISATAGLVVMNMSRWKVVFTLSGLTVATATITAAVTQEEVDVRAEFLASGNTLPTGATEPWYGAVRAASSRVWVPMLDTGGPNGRYICNYEGTADYSEPSTAATTASGYDADGAHYTAAQDAPIHVHYNGETAVIVRWKVSIPMVQGSFHYSNLGTIVLESYTWPEGYVGFDCALYDGVVRRATRSRIVTEPAVWGIPGPEAPESQGYSNEPLFREPTEEEQLDGVSSIAYIPYSDINISDPSELRSAAYLVLSAEDRESVVFVWRKVEEARGGYQTSSNNVSYGITMTSITSTVTGKCAVLIGGSVFETDLAFGARPNYYITTSSIKGFQPLEGGSETSTDRATSTLITMRGNQPDPLQSLRRVADASTYVGGFTDITIDDVVTFVGKEPAPT